MKRLGNFTIGGIQTKVFNLILLTIVLLTAAFIVISANQDRMVNEVISDSKEKQQAAINELSGDAMDQEITKNLVRVNLAEALFAEEEFDDAGRRVTFLAECATRLFADPESYTARPYSKPDPDVDGTWTAMAIFAEGVDENDPAVKAKVGLVANLSDTMIALCKSVDVDDMYIGMPEGTFFSVSKSPSSWFTDGRLREYDPRGRIWYRKAAEAGTLIFSDGELDANTGRFCVECAMPVYDPEGNLQAVAGMDLYLDEIQEVMEIYALEGEFGLLVNQDGKPVFPAQAEAFPMPSEDRDRDLRESRNELLSRTVDTALKGRYMEVTPVQLGDGLFYITAAPIEITGWVLVSAYDQAVSGEASVRMQSSIAAVQDGEAENYRKKLGALRTQSLIMLIAVTVLTLSGAIILGNRIVKPLKTISQRISRLSEGELEFKMEDAYRTGDEVEELAESFASMSHRTIAYMDKVVKVTAERERIGTELSLANQIQNTMLPHLFPAFPDRSEFDIFASMDPAKEVGGDFYDFFLIDDDHLCMVMADVSGKGVPAALFMMASKIIISNNAVMGKTPSEVLRDTNTTLCANGQEDMFVTVWIGILELSTGRLTAANGGHEYPVLEKEGRFEVYMDTHGFLVGGMPGMQYTDYEIRMEPGDKLFVYTDGIPEAHNGELEMFGIERMVDTLNRNREEKPEDLLKAVQKAVDAFVGDAEQFDDLTMLCLEYKGTGTEKE